MGSNKDDIKPINLKTEKEITAEFQKISSVLENQNADWNKRLDALKTLQGMILGNTWTNELFMPNYQRLYGYINFQLKDLRSAVQKEACKLLSLSAEKMQRQFENFAVKYVSKDSLLSIIQSGNKILCENAHSCIQSIIEYCPSPQILAQFLEESNSKNQQVRARISQYLVQILPEINQGQLDRYLQQLDQAIGKGVQDANAEVRLNFRQVFGIYYNLYPQKAERIMANQDTSIKKLLQEEINNSDQYGNPNQSSNNRLLQQKSMDVNIGNYLTTSNNSSNTQKLHQSASMGNNDDSHFHFATSAPSQQSSLAVSSQVSAPSRNINKTPTGQQKANNLLSNSQAGMSTSTSNNNLNKSRNGVNQSQERGIVNNLKQVSDQMTFQSTNRDKASNGNSRISPIRGGANRNETISPLKGTQGVSQVSRSITSQDSKPPVSSSISSQSTKNNNQGSSYASSNFVNAGNESANATIDLLKVKKNVNSQQPVGNQRYNNHQSNQESKVSSSSVSNNISKVQSENQDLDISNNSKKVNAYRSQDPRKNLYPENQLSQQNMQGSRVNSSLTRAPPTQGLQKKPINQKRNSLTEENNNSQDSGQEIEQGRYQTKKAQTLPPKGVNQAQSGKAAPSKSNKFGNQNASQKQHYRDEDEDNDIHNDLDDDDYEPYNRRSHDQFEEEEEELEDQNNYNKRYVEEYQDHDDDDNEGDHYRNGHDDDEEDDVLDYRQQHQFQNNFKNAQQKNNNLQPIKQQQKQLNAQATNQNGPKQRRGNYSSTDIRGEYEEVENQNLSDEDDYMKQKKSSKTHFTSRPSDDSDLIDKQGLKTVGSSLASNQFSSTSRQQPEAGKRVVKSAMNSLKNSDQKNPTLGRQQQQQQQQQQQLINNSSNNFQMSKLNAVSPTGQLLSGNISTKNNNFMAASNEAEDKYMRMNISPPVDEDQAQRYTNNFKNKQQKGMVKSTNSLPKGTAAQQKQNDPNITQSQQQQSWRDDDLELLLEKINNNNNWSTRVSAFESMKEVIGELMNQNAALSQQSKFNNEPEKINPAIMKRIIQSHIEHLSDSHFKVISVCLDSLISLVSYDTTHIIPKLDQLIFKVLNNLIDSKDVVSSKANFLVNILSKVFPGEKLIEPIQKVLEQTNKNLLKICSLEVLMVTVKNAEEYYQTVSNVRHTVQLMCMIIQESQNQKQMALPCLGIILALRDHNQQGTLHSILSLTNQNQITALRNLSYEYAQDLEEDLRKYVQKENIKPTDKIAKSNMKQFQIDQNPSIAMNTTQPAMPQVGTSTTPNSTQMNQMSNTQNGGMFKQNQQPQTMPKQNQIQNPNANQLQNISQLQNQGANQIQKAKQIPNQIAKQDNIQMQNFDIKRIDEIFACVSEFEQNESFIIQYVNDILLNTIEFFKSNNRRTKDQALKILQSLFMRSYFYLTIQPHTVFECLSVYPHIPKDMDFYQVDEVIDEMVDCVPHLIFMKALVEKLNSEKPPQLQIMIKKISYILRKARKEEIRPFLDHIIDSFKLSINDQSPDVRKSVVFCLVDLKCLLLEEVDPYLHQFTGNQQKLVDIYIKKRVSNDGNGGQD